MGTQTYQQGYGGEEEIWGMRLIESSDYSGFFFFFFVGIDWKFWLFFFFFWHWLKVLIIPFCFFGTPFLIEEQ